MDKQKLFFFLKDFIYLFVEREGKEKEGERNINVWLPSARSILGTWPESQACALTGNQTNDPMLRRPALKPLSHTVHGPEAILMMTERPIRYHIGPSSSQARKLRQRDIRRPALWFLLLQNYVAVEAGSPNSCCLAQPGQTNSSACWYPVHLGNGNNQADGFPSQVLGTWMPQ